MAVKFLHKRNNTAGAQPAVDALALGEFAVNTADGEVFFIALVDPAGDLSAANQFVLAVTKPPKADGGVITNTAPAVKKRVYSYDKSSEPSYVWF
ncbi:MAG: hypothetical protein EBU08_04040 [Micrococcales bacterium]|nr:hypothetical protein [Micrococcales bacterium]NDF03733.1 hypothetical protein [Betaproteobacteria bacterium]